MIDTRRLMKIVALAILCAASYAMPAADLQGRKTMTDVNELRKSFVQTFGEDVDLVSDEVREMSGAKYWLACVRAKKSGTFIFRHKFEQTRTYRYMDIECRITVGEKGCSRTLRPDLRPQLFCIGDSVIIPFTLGDQIISHSFSRISRFPNYYESSFDGPSDDRKIDNPAANHLRYTGRDSHVAVHRHGREASVEFNAFFEAINIGRFNLSLSPRFPGAMRHDPGKPPQLFVTSVIIVPKEAPVIGVIASVSVHGVENERWSSAGGAGYPTSVLMLRPGDRISMTYGRTVIPNDKETQGLVKEVEPVIKLLPFSIEPRSYYNDWIIDHVLR